ncbi:DNA-directed RNA polymerase [Phellopilus nigrolimitatus]|nr:DNA-directed RNA polymerase [Phellopilus nigrolimitatus]
MPVPLPTTAPLDVDDRRLVGVHAERVSDVSSADFPGHYPDEDHSWSLDRFKENLRLDVTRLSQRSIELDLVGLDASVANAIRRTLIADVPTLCIEAVYVWNNTSVIHDEVLAHRLGLVPLNVDPGMFEMRDATALPTDRNTLVFKLDVTCTRKRAAPAGATDPDVLYENHLVTAGMLRWEPQGEQADIPQFKRKPPGPTNPDIVLAKLRPGQTIEMECHAVKGVGKEHAKWSPVATASYRIHPYISLLRQPPAHLVREFAACFSPGVVKVIGAGTPDAKVELDPAKVRNESMSREVLRRTEFEGCVKLGRVRDWFLFNVESEGPYAPQDLFPTAIKVLRTRIGVLKQGGDAHGAQGGDADVVMMDA